MAHLLVSVRSAEEARAAVAGGAAVIDVKEPEHGPLGRADLSVWTEVRAAVPAGTPLSLALGELNEWEGEVEGEREPKGSPRDDFDAACFRGFAFRKLGLAGAGTDWEERWRRLRKRSQRGPGWVAVIYADWDRAGAPEPDRVLDAALAADDCAGVLVDTWDKSFPSPVDLTWLCRFNRAREAGRLTALAGGINAEAIARLAPLSPDLFAVRAAACFGGDRRAGIDPKRVAVLTRATARV